MKLCGRYNIYSLQERRFHMLQGQNLRKHVMVVEFGVREQKGIESIQKELQVSRQDHANSLNEIEKLKRDQNSFLGRTSVLENKNKSLLQEKEKIDAAMKVSLN